MTFPPLTGGCSEGGLDAFRIFFLNKFLCLFMLKAVSYEDFFPRNFGAGGVKKFPWEISSGAQSEHLGPSLRAVLMGTKSCTKILNFSTRFSCENLAVEDFVTLLMGKKSC